MDPRLFRRDNQVTLRDIMTKEIAQHGWMDYAFERGDDNAKEFSSYVNWLNSLDDEDFLYCYKRVRDYENSLD